MRTGRIPESGVFRKMVVLSVFAGLLCLSACSAEGGKKEALVGPAARALGGAAIHWLMN